jgi:hypothetical protein
MGGLEQFGRGALQSLKDIPYGLQQLGAEVGDMFTRPANPQARSRQILGGEPRTAPVTGPAGPLTGTAQRLRQEQDIRVAENAPFMESGPGMAGYALGSIGSLLVPGAALTRAGGTAGRVGQAVTAPRTVEGAATVGGLLGAVQPVGEEESRAMNVGTGAIGGTVGNVAARSLARLAQPVTSVQRPQVERAAQRLVAAGVPVDVAARTGSENLRAVQRFLTDNPLSAGIMRKGEEVKQAAFNRAALKLIGEQGDAAIPQVLAQADDRIGSVMDRVARQTGIKVDDRMLSELVAIEESARMTLEPAKLAPLQAQFNNILGKLEPGDSIPGDAYQRIRTIARELGNNPALAGVSKQLRSTIDSALERSAGKEAAADLKLARKQYRNLERIKESMGATETGDIPIPALARATSVKRERGAALMNRGDADLARLARSANTMRDVFPQSGTTPRAAIQAIGGTVAPAAAAAGYSAYQGDRSLEDYYVPAALGIAGLAATRGGARLYQNPAFQQYLQRGIQTNPFRQMMLSPALRGGATYGLPAGLLAGE